MDLVPSSDQPDPPAATSPSAPADRLGPAPATVRLSRLAFAGVGLLVVCISFPVLGYPAAFGWLLLVPIAVGIWIERVQTRVDTAGIAVRQLFSSREVTWDQVEGLRFPKRGWARAKLADGSEMLLPPVTFNDLPEVSRASGGRIPDPFASEAAARTAADREEDRPSLPDRDDGGSS